MTGLSLPWDSVSVEMRENRQDLRQTDTQGKENPIYVRLYPEDMAQLSPAVRGICEY